MAYKRVNGAVDRRFQAKFRPNENVVQIHEMDCVTDAQLFK